MSPLTHLAVVAHPSRNAPLCDDCTYQQRMPAPAINPLTYCNHPSQPRHLDNGSPKVRCHVARENGKRCEADGMAFCGLSGLLFAPRVG